MVFNSYLQGLAGTGLNQSSPLSTGIAAGSPGPDPNAGASPEPDMADVYQSVMGAAHTLLSMPEDQRKQVYPKVVEYLGQKDPRLGQALANAPMPTTQDLQQMVGGAQGVPPTQGPTQGQGPVAPAPQDQLDQAPVAALGVRGDNTDISNQIMNPQGVNADDNRSLLDKLNPISTANAEDLPGYGQQTQALQDAQYKAPTPQALPIDPNINTPNVKLQEGTAKGLGRVDSKRVDSLIKEADKARIQNAEIQSAMDIYNKYPDMGGVGGIAKNSYLSMKRLDPISGGLTPEEQDWYDNYHKLQDYNLPDKLDKHESSDHEGGGTIPAPGMVGEAAQIVEKIWDKVSHLPPPTSVLQDRYYAQMQLNNNVLAHARYLRDAMDRNKDLAGADAQWDKYMADNPIRLNRQTPREIYMERFAKDNPEATHKEIEDNVAKFYPGDDWVMKKEAEIAKGPNLDLLPNRK